MDTAKLGGAQKWVRHFAAQLLSMSVTTQMMGLAVGPLHKRKHTVNTGNG